MIEVRPEDPGGSGAGSDLADLIRANKEAILQAWERDVRTLTRAAMLERPMLVDHVPALLDRIAELTKELGDHGVYEPLSGPAREHALARLDEGFDVVEVIGEFRALRRSVLSVCAIGNPEALRIVNDAIDGAILDSVRNFMDVRDRMLDGIDRVATAALYSATLDDLLHRLIGVLRETAPAIDMGSIYLRTGDVLQLRAVVGMHREAEEGMTMRIGDGFAGIVAARREPVTLHRPEAAQVRSPLLANAGVRTLYGVPIIEGTELLGVAKMASLTADDFSTQDKRMFRAMVARAGAGIQQHMLRERAREAAERVATSERQLQALADNLPQLVWLSDTSGAIYWRNRRWDDYAADAADILGLIHADHRDRVAVGFRHAVVTGEPWEDMFPVRTQQGSYRWVLAHGVPIRGPKGAIERWVGTATDVTVRRFIDQATAVLYRSLDYQETIEQLARLVVPDLADWCIVDLLEGDVLRHAAVVHADPDKLARARELVQLHRPDPVGAFGGWPVIRSAKAVLVSEQDVQRYVASLDEPLATLVREIGLSAWLAVPLVVHEHALGVLHLMTSSPARRFSELDAETATELGQRAGAAIENARLHRDAQEAIQQREQVLAVVSHDLRNPLSSIALGAETIEQLTTEPRVHKQVDAIRRSAGRMERLILDLIDLANINARHFAIDRVRLDAGELVDELFDMYAPLAADRGITLARDGELRGAPLLADRNRLMQALGNLVGNALKFCPPGGAVTIQSVRDGERVQIAVADTGPGIRPEDLAYLFQPFWSRPVRTDRQPAGSMGMGLYITKAIIDAHDGTIAVDSSEQGGARFIVTLPITNASPPTRPIDNP